MRERFEGGAGGHHIVDDRHVQTVHPCVDLKCPTDVLAACVQIEPRLRGGFDHARDQRGVAAYPQCAAERLRNLPRLVVAAFDEAR
jgi:hypothetical protein